MKTIGTLEEIGAQVGDVVEYIMGETQTYTVSSKPETLIHHDGRHIEYAGWITSPYWRIITRASKSPVRTVTRKEIVPGIYGKVTVTNTMSAFGCCGIQIYDDMSASELTAAIATLTEIRDAMQNNA